MSMLRGRENCNISCWAGYYSLLLFPFGVVLLPYLHGWINIITCAFGTYFIFKYRESKSFLSSSDKMFIYSVASMVLVAFLVTAISGIDETALGRLGKFLYLFFAIPVFLFFRFVGVDKVALWYGMVFGAILSGFVALYDVLFHEYKAGYIGRAHGVSHPIIFGDLSLLIGAMALVSIGWFKERTGSRQVVLSVIAVLMGLLASSLSQARGGWVAIPVIVLVLTWFYGKRVAKWKLGLAVLMLIVAMATVYKVPQSGVADKVGLTLKNIQLYFETDVSHESHGSSLGSRFEMWRASWQIFTENPIFGVGWGGYQENAKQLVDQGVRHRTAALWPHPHNQFMSALASGGILGFIATVALFLVPLVIFFRVLKSTDSTDDESRMALVGVLLVLSFAIFNLSESFLERSRTVGFFVFYLAVCMAGIRREGGSNT